MAVALRDLEVLLAVDREGSFGRAATALLQTQPAVSERIRNLERAVGRPLVARTSRGTTLTPAGRALAEHAARCLALAEEGVEAARGVDDVPRFVLAGHPTFAARIVPAVFAALVDPPRRVVLRDEHSHEVLALVQDGVADLGVTLAAPVPTGLRRHALPDDPVVAVVGADHPLAGRRRLGLGALGDCLVAVSPRDDEADEAVERLGDAIDPWRVRRCADAGTAVVLARDHGHVALVPESAATAELDRGALRRVSVAGMPGWAVRTQVVHRAASGDDPAIRAVLAVIL